MGVNRVCLITDAELMAELDAVLARWAPKWMRLSGPKLDERIDWWVERVDPEGPRVPGARPQDRYVEIWPTESGLAAIEAQPRATDATALDQRLDALADTVCGNDPRTKEQRRADALGALAAGLSGLGCECESPDCTAAQRPTGATVVIHVLAERATIDRVRCRPILCRVWPRRPSSSRSASPIRNHRPSRGIARRQRWPNSSVRVI